MMGTLVCKPCVKYIDNCIHPSSSESDGIYILKTTDDEKRWDIKPRSLSISTETTNISTFNKTVGFWNSWESINTISSKKRQGQSISKSARLCEEDGTSDAARINSVEKMLGRKLTYSTASKIEKDRIPNALVEKCGRDKRYQERQQLEDTLSSSSSYKEPLSSNKSQNGEIQLYQEHLTRNYGINKTYPEKQHVKDTSSSSYSCEEIPSCSNDSENEKIQLHQGNLRRNYGTYERNPKSQQFEDTPSSSSSCEEIPSSSNESENGQIQLYQGNLMGNYWTNGRYRESQQFEDIPSSTSPFEVNPSTSNKPENEQVQLYQRNLVDAFPSTSNLHQKRSKTANSDGFKEAMKGSAECDEKSHLQKSIEEISHSTNMENIQPIIVVSGAIESSVSSGNICEDSEREFLIELESESRGAVPKIRSSSTTQIQADVLLENHQHHNNLLEEEGNGLDDLKNMTAEVSVNSYRNHSIGRDTGDNGNSFLNQIPTSKLLATEKGRLKTYKNWLNKNIDPRELAAAGFYYSGKTDIVECFRCGIKGHNWLENDKPMEDHKKWNRNCPFVRENATEQDNAPQTRTGRDYCGNLGVEISQYTESEEPEDYCRNLGVQIYPILESGARTERSESPNLEKLGIRATKGPCHPDQIILENRLSTFVNWPKSLKQKPAELAAAGFYYLGIGDQTLCFFCGGGLKDWVEEDDPWEQHALWFPQCNYLLLKKSPAFVETVQREHKRNLSSKQDETEVVASCSTSNNAKETSSAAVEEKERNNSEESSTICKICYKNELGVVFLPCGHMVACVDCASGLKECAICRKEIQANVRAFLA